MENSIPAYRFERVSQENLSDLVYLMKSVHGQSKPIEYYEKKFRTKQFGADYIGFFAYAESNEPAAYYGVFPCLLEADGTKFLGAQSGDTITHPEHQRKGLFVQLARMTYDLAKSEGIQVIFGFPNSQSGPGFYQKLNWIEKGEFTSYNFEFKNHNLYNITNRFSSSKWLYQLYFRLIYSAFRSEGFENPEHQKESITVVHDKTYFTYKAFEKSYFVKVNGVQFWIKFDDGIRIGTMQNIQGKNSKEYLRAIRKLSNLFGTKKVSIIIDPNSVFFKLLNDNVEDKSIGISIGYLELNPKTNNQYCFTYADLDTF